MSNIGAPVAHTCGCSPPIVVVTASTMSIVFVRTLAILNLHLSSHVATASVSCLLLACCLLPTPPPESPPTFEEHAEGAPAKKPGRHRGLSARALLRPGSASFSVALFFFCLRRTVTPTPYHSLLPRAAAAAGYNQRGRGARAWSGGRGRGGIHLLWRSSRRHSSSSSSISCVAVPGRQPITARPRRAPLFALRADMNEKRQTLSVSAPSSSSSSETGGCNF